MKAYAVATINGRICYTTDCTGLAVYQVYRNQQSAIDWCEFLNMGKSQPTHKVRPMTISEEE